MELWFFLNCHTPYKSSCLKCMYVFPSLISNMTKVFKGKGQYRWKMKTWLNYVKTNHYLLSLLSLWPYVKVFDCHCSLSFHMLVKHLSDAYSRVLFDTCPFLFWVQQGLMSKPFEKNNYKNKREASKVESHQEGHIMRSRLSILDPFTYNGRYCPL